MNDNEHIGSDFVMCPDCGGVDHSEEILDETLMCILPTEVIVVQVPVMTCNDCGFQYTDYRAEEIHDAAVKNRHK
jgi:rubredoxin